ncbi:MAG: PEP-CTERM sorting domain-containing protein [Xanthobacteraceae bacterium]|nr:PEP-CTERM sorting domain-containing protein [Xanthobacteraceae bacterium]
MKLLSVAKSAISTVAVAGALISTTAYADVITYDVNLTFDPNASPSSSLEAAGPGTVTGTFTIDTSIPISSSPTGNLVAANLLERSNNGTILSVFSNSASQLFNTVAPYTITFLWSPVTEYPAQSSLTTKGVTPYEYVSFSSGPVFDSIQEGPSIQFDFPYTSGGSVIPGNFDSIASTGFNAYLFGTVTPEVSAVPEPRTWAMLLLGFAGLGLIGVRRSRRGAIAAA